MPDFLPPGNTPIITESDPADQIAAIARETYDAIWPRTILKYDNAAARDADLAGLAPSETCFAFTYDTGYLWFWYANQWRVMSGTSNWVPMTVGAGHTVTSGYPLQSRIVYNGGGRTVEVSGAVTRGGSGGLLATLTADHRPSSNRWLGAHVSSGGVVYELLVQSSGAIGFATGYASGSTADGQALPLSGSFQL